jgi:hypothetical protein
MSPFGPQLNAGNRGAQSSLLRLFEDRRRPQFGEGEGMISLG